MRLHLKIVKVVVEGIEVKDLLGIPPRVATAALIPVGHPRRRHGPPRRIPAAERTHHERWRDS